MDVPAKDTNKKEIGTFELESCYTSGDYGYAYILDIVMGIRAIARVVVRGSELKSKSWCRRIELQRLLRAKRVVSWIIL